MTPTDKERQAVATRLRSAAIDDGHIDMPYGKQGFQVTLQRIIGTSNPKRSTLYNTLANLIDPTCEVVKDNPYMSDFDFVCKSCREHFSSCNEPKYCPHCGCRVVSHDDN
jgi:hypothetical protein